MEQDREVRLGVEATDSRPMSQILGAVIADLQAIFRGEVRLAISELGEKARQSSQAGIFLAGAAVMGLLAALCFLATCVAALSIVLPVWLSTLLMGVVLALGAGGAFLMGRMRLESVDPLPQRTIETLKDDIDWARNRTGG